MKDINNRISKTLKSLRQERKWSLDKAAAETGVSKAMLGQIERGESSPTIATLWKIACGFQTSFSSFIEDLEPYFQEPIHRAGVAQHLHLNANQPHGYRNVGKKTACIHDMIHYPNRIESR